MEASPGHVSERSGDIKLYLISKSVAKRAPGDQGKENLLIQWTEQKDLMLCLGTFSFRLRVCWSRSSTVLSCTYVPILDLAHEQDSMS